MATRTAKKASSKKATPKRTTLEPIEYDPLNSEFTMLHRAGMAGLLLQIETMRKLRESMSEEEKQQYKIPACEPIHDGRGIVVTFTEESFHSLMQERYRGVLVRRVVGKENHKLRQKPKAKPKRYIYEDSPEHEKFSYLDPRPLLQYFEEFKAPLHWQEHTRDAIWKSYYCIYNNQLIFKLPSEASKSNKVDELWNSLLEESLIKLDKPIYPSAFANNLKGVDIRERSTHVLLLHFWPLVTAHFIPVNLKADKDKKTKEARLRNDFQPPVIVVPDVTDAGVFVDEFTDYLGRLGNASSGKLYQDGRYIATPLEASLAFFVVSRLARGVRAKIGTRGAEVYVFSKPQNSKQPLVTAIVNESFEPRLLDEYKTLLEKQIWSLPFRAVCVENLLAQPRRYLYEGFERLVDQYPLELFIANKSKDGKTRRFLPHGYQMARSLNFEFTSIEKKEKQKMSDEAPSIPFLFWDVARNYIRWRACNKAEPPVEVKNINALLAKKIQKQKLTSDEEKRLKTYNKAVGEVVERLFIDFRGYREMEGFANAFTETFFRAPQRLKPEQAERLKPFYEGAEWESGRRLVLMAISAEGANASSKASDDLPEDIPEADSDDSKETT